MWRPVCSKGWDLPEAGMVCRHLGYHTAVAVLVLPFFYGFYEMIRMEYFQCSESEMSLSECSHISIEHYYYYSNVAAGVVCDVLSAGTEKVLQDVRLAEGYSNSSGRVEVLIDGEWGGVCANGWTLADAGVVCRQLGYHTSIAILVSYDQYWSVWVNYVDCRGNETSLSECKQAQIWQYDCSDWYSAGVVCGDSLLSAGTENVLQDVRLAEGYSNSSGRVEVLIDGEWGGVCTDGWTLADAGVVCRHLGYQTTIAIPVPYDQYGSVWVNYVDCRGKETSLSECKQAQIWQYDCSDWDSAGVVCGVLSAGTENVLQDVRLAEGYSNSSGRVEVLIDGEWGGVCTDGWTLADAGVVCRQLGYQTTIAIPVPYDQYGSVWVNYVDCRGNETSLSECKQAQIWQYDCSGWYSAGVVCGGKKSLMDRENVIQILRLVGGPSNSSGRLEVFFNNEWGTICDDGWDLVDATVACRELGYQVALFAYKQAFFGNGSGFIWLTNVQCGGNESSLAECKHEIFAEPQCSHHQDVGVLCGGESAFYY
ncbi:hypothetical protein HOLleu_21535 [Holothuria leucospilota]|uniref:SRCR domain-containing protein n=1 Tax=Holothuria leucospilota TaxID=206669 RepID=A0A9Q1BXF2_HOLLE|nr:hypothetical protein HOLleu_21535 [Holothuria leucospilota]